MSLFWNPREGAPRFGVVWAFVGLFAILVTSAGMWGCPRYNVWQRHMAGKAALARAEQDRQIRIHEANAAMESAKLLAEAEIERAKGVAEANKIIATTLDEQYLRYLFLQGLHDGNSEVIYVPTEANLPILEAMRFKGRSE